jgi:penicillin-binding protein 1A
MAYSTKIRLNQSRFSGKIGAKRNLASSNWQKRSTKKSRLGRLKKAKVKKILFTALAIFFVAAVVGLIFLMSYVQSITEDLPSKDKPFGKKSTASEIYDRNGKLLYRVFGDENRDPVDINQVPDLLKWSFLSAEDRNFYSHPGFDVSAILRCGIDYLRASQSSCGGSTITQQLIKQTALTNERNVERKVKEIILALQIEREHSKSEILQMYLTVAPEGSNIYGITSASKFYFGKELKDLNLAEMTILASIPQDPTNLSPTKSSNPEQSQKRVKDRQLYVLKQMEDNIDFINQKNKEITGKNDDILTKQMIEDARNYTMVYRKPSFEIKAPHFVFYVEKLLQQRAYNNGEPFTLSDIETGGYKITTTLDLDMQSIAEEQVKKGVDVYGARYGAYNAALVALNPKDGEVLAMAGSKDYFGENLPKGCKAGVNCRFEPNVNITDTLQSYGSSMKPMIYYDAMMQGIINPASQLADIPIRIGNYEPKNYEGGFTGIRPARKMLSDSRNIPAIYLVNQLGIDNYVDMIKKWGYTTFTNPAGYGPSISIGGGDVKLIEHAQAYGVFANEGKFTQHEVILSIKDAAGNEIFKYEPKSEQVADPRGVYVVNDILNGKKGGPGDAWDGRDVSGKTGTSENQKETLFATYTPEIVVVGWLGNNDNTPMRAGASGFDSAKPWIAEFLRRVGGSIPKTPFPRPGGIILGGSCSAETGASCDGFGGDLAIAGIGVPSYVSVYNATVCKDETDKLARDIDISLGYSETILRKYYSMPDKRLQPYLDKYMTEHPDLNAGPKPTVYCDINRNPAGNNKPWAVITNPTVNQLITTTLPVSFTAYSPNAGVTKAEVYYDGTLLGTTTTIPYSNTFTVGPQSPGQHTVDIKVFDSAGENGTTSVNVEVLGSVTITSPASVPGASSGNVVTVTYSGYKLDSATLYVDGTSGPACTGSGTNWTCSWTAPAGPGTSSLQVKGVRQGQSMDSNTLTVILT